MNGNLVGKFCGRETNSEASTQLPSSSIHFIMQLYYNFNAFIRGLKLPETEQERNLEDLKLSYIKAKGKDKTQVGWF